MEIAIIGGGACGLLLASILEKNNINYKLFNRGKIGNKILASGNGRCNISNDNFKMDAYHNNPLACKIVSENYENLFDYFNELKIYTKIDSEGRMYPISESSQSVLDLILKKINNRIIDTTILNIKNINNKYYLNDSFGPFDKVILAYGSIAGYKPPYTFLDFTKELNLEMVALKPSLVGFKTYQKFKEISGTRAKVLTKLYQNNNLIHEENGEVIFKDDGISGICIMNLSSYYANLKNTDNCYISLDFSPYMEFDDYTSIINPKLLKYIIKNNIPIHNFKINIQSTYDFSLSQVCKGGISISEINDDLSLKKHPNIYVGGECIDVDAVCGGYNLMFAFCCAIKLGKELICK